MTAAQQRRNRRPFRLQQHSPCAPLALIRIHPSLHTTDVLHELAVEILDAVGRLETPPQLLETSGP